MSYSANNQSATGPGAGDALVQALLTLCTTNGWTQHDIIATTTGARDVVLKGGSLDATAGNAPFIRITQTSTTAIDFRAYTDWDTTTHAGMNVTGNATSTTRLTVQDATFSYWARANAVALFVCAKVGASYNKIQAGFLRRRLPLAMSGMTKTSQSYASGVSTMNVASSMVGKLKAGQKVWIVNYAHASGNANASNIELVTILSVAAGSVTFTGNTTKAYDSGALIGTNVLPIFVSGQITASYAAASFYFPVDIDGTRTGATSHNATSGAERFTSSNLTDGPNAWGVYEKGGVEVATNTAGKTGVRGWLYHVDWWNRGAIAAEDLIDDGAQTFVCLGPTTNFAMAMGPQN